MASAREIQSRMQSIKDTMKITSAMYMISSSKMQKAKKSLADTEPFFFAQQNAVARFMKSVPDTNNVLKLASEQLEKGGQNKLFVVGELGRQYFMKKDVNIDGEFSYTVQNPTLYRARHIGLQLIDEYVREELDEVYIIYTKMINAFKMEADMFQLLPLQREEYTHKNLKGYSDRMTFHPSVESVLNSLIPNVVCGFVYGALVESYASEHNSRMMAMQTATDSAKQMLHDLEIEYNRVRQAAITQEITEVIAGAKAQKSKKK